ncbi:YrhB domain-containing protein [Myxococcus sp. 1LA]
MPIDSLEHARRLALEEARRGWTDEEDPIVINDAVSYVTGYGWVFFYNLRSVIEGRKPLGLMGNGPIVVLRDDGSVHRIPAARWRQALEDFEAALSARKSR